MRFRTSIVGVVMAVTPLAAAPAAAHVTIDPAEAPAGGFATLQVQVPHGCEGSPTREVRVRIPKSVPSVTPQVHPGWDVTTREGPKDAVQLHGETVTRGVAEVVWTAADAGPLPDGRLDLFGMSVKLPAGAAGDEVYFPAVQQCTKGSEAWIQVPQAGENEDELESPAPAVTLTAVDGDQSAASHDGEAGAASGSGDDGPSTGLVIAALVLGGLGLLTALTALAGGGRRTA